LFMFWFKMHKKIESLGYAFFALFIVVGICAVDETEKGWFVAYIDRTSDAILAEERRSKKAKLEKDDEKRTQKYI
ncbi:hypothetical protein ACS4XG_25040, partial [Escherichia coli]|uniref:hypothetical protein n=1 Tax=Escherichia coli TaxID=562 RepID=UPI003F439048